MLLSILSPCGGIKIPLLPMEEDISPIKRIYETFSRSAASLLRGSSDGMESPDKRQAAGNGGIS